MPDITDFLVDCGLQFWEFMTSGWFVMSIVAVKLILPKIFGLFRQTFGR